MFHHRQMHFGDVPSNSESLAVPTHQHNTVAFPPLNLSRIAPHNHAAALEYDTYLRQLTFNSKEMITNLTRIAGENMDSCEAIAMTIEQRTFHAPPLLKLPFLYLMDSIVKNIGANYIACFSANLFHSFTAAYAVVPPQVRMSMHRMLNTWPPYFGLAIVAAMHHAISDQGVVSSGRPNLSAMSQSRSAGHHGHLLPIPPSQPSRHPHMPHSAPFHVRNSVPPRPPQSPAPPSILMTGEVGVPPGATSNYPPSVTPITDNRPRLRSQPVSGSVPRAPAVSVADRAIPATGASAEFLRTQDMMQDIIRKASLGAAPSNHQLFNMNRLITTQLQNAATPPAQRDTLFRFQQQLRQAASIPHPQRARVNSAPVIPSSPAMTSVPFPIGTPLPIQNMNAPITSPTSSMSVVPPIPPPSLLHAIGRSQALSGLLRSIPSGLLSTASAGLSSHVVSSDMPHFATQQPGIAHTMSSMGVPPSSIGAAPSVLQSEAPMYQSHVSSPLEFTELSTISHASSVRALYVDLPFLSKSDGMRFATQEKLRDHLDWVFQRNRRKRAIANKEILGGHSRCWFDTVSSFLKQGDSTTDNKDNTTGAGAGGASDSQGGGNNGSMDMKSGTDNDSRKNAVPIKGDNEVCAACGETFETFWDDDKHSWMLADAIRVEESGVFHTNCLESTQVTGESELEHPLSEKGGDDSVPTTPNVSGTSVKAETIASEKLEPKVDALTENTYISRHDNKVELQSVKNENALEGGVVKLQNNKESVDPVKTESELLDATRSELLSDADLVPGRVNSNETQGDKSSAPNAKEGGQKRKREEKDARCDEETYFDSNKDKSVLNDSKESAHSQKRIKVDDGTSIGSVSLATLSGVNEGAVNSNGLSSFENADLKTMGQGPSTSLETHHAEANDQSLDQKESSTGDAATEEIANIFEEDQSNVHCISLPGPGAALGSIVE